MGSKTQQNQNKNKKTTTTKTEKKAFKKYNLTKKLETIVLVFEWTEAKSIPNLIKNVPWYYRLWTRTPNCESHSIAIGEKIL